MSSTPEGTGIRRAQARMRFWVEVALGLIFVALLALTIAVPDWIEEIFGISPDGGDGHIEWLIVAVCLLAIVVSFASAGLEWRRTLRLSRSTPLT